MCLNQMSLLLVTKIRRPQKLKAIDVINHKINQFMRRLIEADFFLNSIYNTSNREGNVHNHISRVYTWPANRFSSFKKKKKSLKNLHMEQNESTKVKSMRHERKRKIQNCKLLNPNF